MVANTVDNFLKNLSIFCFLIFPAALVAGPFAAELSMKYQLFFCIMYSGKKIFFFVNKIFF